LPGELKWAYSLSDLDIGPLPPRDTYYEAIRDPRFNIYASAGIDGLRYEDQKIVGSYGGSEFSHDFMICGTGSRNAIIDQAELNSLIPLIQLWKDGHIPPGLGTHPELESSPYLGRALQFLPTDPRNSFISRVYYLCSGVAHLSGYRCNISGMSFAVQTVCNDISKSLFLQHQEEVESAFDHRTGWE
jgi:hypothetical protein